MAITTFSSREFNQDLGRAKRAAEKGPVLITDRGEPAFVLLRHDDYRKLVGKGPSLLEALAMPGTDDIDFELPARSKSPMRIPDLG